MDFEKLIVAMFQYGGTVIMAVLFIWVFVTDKTKNDKTLEDNTKMLQALTESNNNIAKALDIISNNLVTIDKKIDRNYEVELKKKD